MSSGWGGGEWGSSPWGSGFGAEDNPVITPLAPVDGEAGVSRSAKVQIRFTDNLGITPSRTNVSVNATIWVLGGVGINGATVVTTPNSGNGFDMVITPPAPYPSSSRQEVLVTAENTSELMSSLVYFFYVGVGLRLLKAENPFDNVIVAFFNRPMRLNGQFFDPRNWIITPVSVGAKPLTIVDVNTYAGQASVARLRYEGGGSTYELSPLGVTDLNGDGLENGYDATLFEILFGDEETPTIKLFDSIFGPLGISQRLRTRRTMDDHVSNRAMALALDEQFRLRMQRLDGTAGRDGKPGTRRT